MLLTSSSCANTSVNNEKCSKFINYSIKEAALKYPFCPTYLFEIGQIYVGQLYFSKLECIETFSDMFFYMTICRNGHAGFAYTNKTINENLKRFINKSVLEVFEDDSLDMAIRIACADAAMHIYNEYSQEKPTDIFACKGNIKEKANIRSCLLAQYISEGQQVLLVGAVPEIARDVLKSTKKLRITECGQDSCGTKLYDIPIEMGVDSTLNLLEKSDIAIVTGATMTSNTIDDILEIGAKNNVDMRFYLETGTGFSDYLFKKGAKLVLAEAFPYYNMPGITKINLYYDDKIRKYQ